MIVPELLVRQELWHTAGVHWAGQAGSAGDAREEERLLVVMVLVPLSAGLI